MLIGEAPGREEAKHFFYTGNVQTGRPFVGPAGHELKAIMDDLGITMQDVYITNAVKHRPPKNRKPEMAELLTCIGVSLIQEIRVVQPEEIVCLGHTASLALSLLATHELPNPFRGTTFKYENATVTCTWHPAYACLYEADKTPELVSDIKKAFSRIT